jgi:hypothetical protein
MNSPLKAVRASHHAKPGKLPITSLFNSRASSAIDMDQALAAVGDQWESKRYGCKVVKMMY